MKSVGKILKFLGVFVVLAILIWAVVDNYSLIFSKKVTGEITAVERIDLPVALIARTNTDINNKVFSFAVGIRDLKTGEIYTASSEERPWAAAQKGQCAEAEFFPYPPWDFKRKGTYFGAQLLKLYDCAKN